MVGACRLKLPEYPTEPPFHPAVSHPEYPFKNLGPVNRVYEGVRNLFELLKLDSEHQDTAAWNPLGTIVRPGDKVLIKPNLIGHSHRYRPGEFEQVITHGSVVRAVTDYVLLALQGRGEVWIADGPQLDADWTQIMSRTGIASVCEWYQSQTSVPVRLVDLRDTWEHVRGDVLFGTTALPGDPNGSVDVNLAERSRFAGHGGAGRYYGASYDQAETNYHHSNGRQEYRISRTAAAADVLINLPKMKTHKKTGVTVCLKNLVGINTGRNWLPHHTDGNPSDGGDQFMAPSVMSSMERKGIRSFEQWTLKHPAIAAPLFRLAKTIAKPIWGDTRQTIRSGNWHGNDTTWRMVHDINRCLFYSQDQSFPIARPKRFFAVVDGVVSGQGDGPAAPDRSETGLLLAGFNPVAVDCVTARLMGFDPMKIPMLREAFVPSDLPLVFFDYAAITIASQVEGWNGGIEEVQPDTTFHLEPHFGWTGYIEWKKP
jgi:uncharacterized protein (DUF362 family)